MNVMAGTTYKVINMVPAIKIKEEVIDDDEDCVLCRLCAKSFATEMALRNHARMEHFDAYSTGDPNVWTLEQDSEQKKSYIDVKKEAKKQEKLLINQRTKELISSMEPMKLASLASQDVSYVIVKGEGPEMPEVMPKKRKKEDVVVETRKKEKKTIPISGPFECLQPSTLVADGTCHQIFFSCCEYSIHFRDEHTRRKKRLRCQVCEKPLSGNPGDESIAPFPCQVCEAGFQTNRELSDHIDVEHVKLKPYECHVCHKRFTQQGGVQQHMRMHTGVRPFPCTFCTKAFTQKSGLDQHLRIHTRVKPYRCVVCDKSFCQSIHLKQHMRTHTNVAPFRCLVCDKRFKQSSHLNYHMRVHAAALGVALPADHRLVGMLNHGEIVEVEIDQTQDHLQMQESESNEGEDGFVTGDGVKVAVEHLLDNEQDEETVQSITIHSDENSQEQIEYILQDTANEMWSVKIV